MGIVNLPIGQMKKLRHKGGGLAQVTQPGRVKTVSMPSGLTVALASSTHIRSHRVGALV